MLARYAADTSPLVHVKTWLASIIAPLRGDGERMLRAEIGRYCVCAYSRVVQPA